MPNLASDVFIALKRGLRLVTFLHAPLPQSTPRVSTVAVLLVLDICALAALQAIDGGNRLAFNSFGLTSFAAQWGFMIFLLALFAANMTEGTTRRVFADLVSTSVLVIGLMACLSAVKAYGPKTVATLWSHETLGDVLTWSLSLLFLISAVRIGRQYWPKGYWLRGTRAIAASLLPVFLLPIQPMVWGSKTEVQSLDVWQVALSWMRSRDAGDEQAAAPIVYPDYEGILYRQGDLVSKAVAGVRRAPRPSGQLFYVGVGASATEQVFRREVASATQIFSERFDVADRAVTLVNSMQTADTLPLATVTNLERVLKGVGSVMDRDNDVLVMFVTTHGSKERLMVQFPGMSLNQLSAEKLASMLDESGIKNRVLIISACHSGSFIPPLANETTLIMTASHADRTSFGCSNEREWTYFGDALFNHALRETTSLPKAFEIARAKIGEWEASQKLTPSEPQISIGARVLDKLANADARPAPIPAKSEGGTE